MSSFSFTILEQDGASRTGQLTTKHGIIHTPAFAPVGTAATIKTMTQSAVAATGTQLVLANTYHLTLSPGIERIAQLGGLHIFMDWPGPILTDSGGFQIMSLSGLQKIGTDGIVFRSHLDGSYHSLTPEYSIISQELLDSDISMSLDVCAPFSSSKEEVRAATYLSMSWAERCRMAFKKRPGYAIFGIVQGGVYPDLRVESTQNLLSVGFDGYAIGGLAVGEILSTRLSVLDNTVLLLPRNQPRYLMGAGKPVDLIEGVLRGVDLFDCVLPTRFGRIARAFTQNGVLNLRNSRFAKDCTPLDEKCTCVTCCRYDRAYLHHLARCGEVLCAILLSSHNIHFYQTLMKAMREAIAGKKIIAFSKEFLVNLAAS